MEKLVNSVITQINSNKKCMAIFLDLAKAFDKVAHDILLEKLEKVGVRGKALDLYRDSLSGRYQKVSTNWRGGQ